MTKIYEMVKQSLMDGLRNANYDATRFHPDLVKVGLFSDRTEVLAAESSCRTFYHSIRMRLEKGETFTRNELINEVELKATEGVFTYATSAIQILPSAGKNISKYINEAHEAVNKMVKLGHPNAKIYDDILRKLILEK